VYGTTRVYQKGTGSDDGRFEKTSEGTGKLRSARKGVDKGHSGQEIVEPNGRRRETRGLPQGRTTPRNTGEGSFPDPKVGEPGRKQEGAAGVSRQRQYAGVGTGGKITVTPKKTGELREQIRESPANAGNGNAEEGCRRLDGLRRGQPAAQTYSGKQRGGGLDMTAEKDPRGMSR